MERFNLNTWLEDKSRKIVTRDGKQARIICYDVKQGKDDCYVPIIALVDKGEELGEMSFYYSEDGSFLRNPNQTHNLDLFFADDEKELTEFEKGLVDLVSGWCDSHIETPEEYINKHSQALLDLAKKEIEKENPYSGNQKQEWSEEDEKKINGLVKGLEDRMGFGWASQPFTREEYIEWLKSIKEKVQPQPKQEWSEEDEKIINTIISDITRIRTSCGIGTEEYNIRLTALNWLKSLKDRIQLQLHWKPSEEQMEALFEAKLASIKNREYFLGLLYEDLKKL